MLIRSRVAVSGDSKFIVSGSKDKTIAIWDAQDKKLLHHFEDAHKDAI